jgi:hypothetical protein
MKNSAPIQPDPAWDRDSLPPEVTPVRRDSTVPGLIAMASALIGLPAVVFVLIKLFHG